MAGDRRTPRILVIRRDNIGDLVCTTPLLRALRRQLPHARIAALVTRYNAAVLAGHPDVDAVHAYVKGKHRAPGESRLAIYADRARMILALRRQRFDWVLLPGAPQASALRFARWIGGRAVVIGDGADGHEVERCCRLLPRMGLDYETPTPLIVPAADELARVDAALAASLPGRPRRLVGLHISARKPSQRWPAERFAALARALHAEGAACLLLWAPGREDDPLHPGDDAKAAAVIAQAGDMPLAAIPTARLEQLIAALARCDAMICADGGAMHLAAGLGKPIIALFGHSDAARWRPWGVPHVVLQKASEDVSDISVDEVITAYHGR